MSRSLIRSLIARGGEVLLAVGLVLVFFLAFMGLMSLTFPEGTSLADLMRSGELPGGGTAHAAPRVDVQQADVDLGTPIALLSQVIRDVRDKPADAVAWSASVPGRQLGDYHSVQTAARSGATIQFSATDEMVLDENSLVIVKRAAHVPLENRDRASLLVMGGTLRGHIAGGGSAGPMLAVEAATKGGVLRPVAAPGQAAEFSVAVHDDHSSTFSILSGTAQVVARGAPIAIGANQAVTVDEDGAAGPVVPLPPPPAPLEPGPGHRERYHASRGRLLFRWSCPEPTEGFVITVSRDPAFRDLVAVERVTDPAVTLGNLRAGRYFWRVHGVRGEFEGRDSAPREFTLVQDRRPPDIVVRFPAGTVNGKEAVVSGTTEAGTKVFVDGQETPVDGQGRFSHAIGLKRGVNVVVVEAVTDTGNVAYRSRIINARY